MSRRYRGPDAFRSLRRVFRLLTFRPDPSREIEEEIAFHLGKIQEELERKGLCPREARKTAEIRFGDMRHYRRELEGMARRRVRRHRLSEAIGPVGHSLRLGARTLWRTPGFSLGIILTLALGIGANATMFGILDRLLLSPPRHVVDADGVHPIYLRRMGISGVFTSQGLTYPDLTDLKGVSALSSVGAFSSREEYTLGSGPEAERISGIPASPPKASPGWG